MIINGYLISGWLSRDPTILARVGEVLLPHHASNNDLPNRVLIPDDCFQHLSSSGSRPWEIFTESISKEVGRKFPSHICLQDNMWLVNWYFLHFIISDLIHLDLGEYVTNKVPSLRYFIHRLSEANASKNAGIPVFSALSHAMQTLQR